MTITTQILRSYAADLQTAINEVNAKYGISDMTMDVRRARDGSFLRIMKVDGFERVSPLGQAAKMFAPTLSKALDEYGIGSTRNAKGDVLTGFNPRSPKYCFTYRSAGGTDWKITPEMARKRFGSI